jgi:transcriptional regulator with GAF, ATPase, and Fis domain
MAALREHPISRARLAIVASAVLVCIYAVGVICYVMATPDIGVRCAFTPAVNDFSPEFLYPDQDHAEALGKNDTIIQLGDQEVRNWAQFLHELKELRDKRVDGGTAEDLKLKSGKNHLIVGGEEIIRVLYTRAGEEGRPARMVWLKVGRPPLETLAPSVLWFLLKIGLFVVGAIVFWKRREDRSAALFFLFCLVSFGAYMGGYQWSRIVTQPTLLLVFMICSVLLPVVSLHFYLVFPRPKAILDRAPRRALLVLYGPAVIFLLLLIWNYLWVRRLNQAGLVDDVTQLLDDMLFQIYCYFGVAALWYLASVVCLVHSYRTVVGAAERNQVKWILFGTLASLAPISYSLYLALAERQRFGGGAATWPMFFASLCVTVAFTISITRYRLMQLDQLINSGVVYFLVSSLVGLVYYGLVFIGMVALGSIEGPSLSQVLAASGTALVLLVGLDVLRGRFRSALDRHFRREKHQLDRTLQRMSQAIEQLVDPQALARRLLYTSAELLGAGRGAVYLRQGDPPLYLRTEAVGPPPALAELSSGCPLIEAMAGQNSLALPTQSPPGSPAQRQLHFLGGVLAQGLMHEGQLLGVLLLGAPTEPRGPATEMTGGYTAEDLHLLAAFAHMTVLALVSAEGHRKIDTLNRELQTKVEKIAEQQRRIMTLESRLSAIRHPPSAIDAISATGGEERTADRGQRTADSGGVIGSSLRVRQLMQQVRKVAATDAVVLLRGESGTGKELLARAIHDFSPRAGRPFVAVHCSALSPGLLESELFGHVKGAFTNAIRDKIGRFEAANGGTLFLDEIGDITVEVQIKLLRVLQERTFERVGSSESTKVDVRIIAATHQNLEHLMRQGRFRDDLFFRLNVLPIELPPLRERAEDVPELALHFLRQYSERMNKQVHSIDEDAMMHLKAYFWPGNIRQLENVIQRAVVIADKPMVTVEDLPAEFHSDPFPLAALDVASGHDGVDRPAAEGLREVADHWSPLLSPPPSSAGILATPPALLSAIQGERAERDRRERELLVRALAAAAGNKAEAARALGMARSTFISRLKRLGLT